MAPENRIIFISTAKQEMTCFENDLLVSTYCISTSKNGVGEKKIANVLQEVGIKSTLSLA